MRRGGPARRRAADLAIVLSTTRISFSSTGADRASTRLRARAGKSGLIATAT
jgi:hypothetical protein